MVRIKNENYRKFLDTGIIELIEEHHIEQALRNVKGIYGKYILQGRALLITQYYTGGRPNEVLRIKAKDITEDASYIRIFIQGSKKGLPRPIYIRKKLRFAQELHKYAKSLPPDMYLFYNYKNAYERKTKKGTRTEIDTNWRYYCKKWFEGVIQGSITPYYLRHNRFSGLALKGATIQEIRMLKGSRTDASVMPYLHMSARTGKQIAKRIT